MPDEHPRDNPDEEVSPEEQKDVEATAEAAESAGLSAIRQTLRPHVRMSKRLTSAEILAIVAGFGLYALLLMQTIAWTNSSGVPGIHPVFPLGALLFFLYPFRTHLVSRRLMQLAILTFLIWLAANLSGVLFPFIFSFVIAYIASRAVDKMEHWHIPRWASALSVVIVILGIYALVGFWLIPAFVGQMDELLASSQRLFQGADSILREETLIKFLTDLGVPQADAHDIVIDRVMPQIELIASEVFVWMGQILQNLTSVIEGIVSLVLIPFVTFYFLLDFNRIRVFIRSKVLQDNPDYVYFLRRVDTIVNSYLGGILLTSSIVGVLATLAFTFFGVPYALVLGILAGVFNLIPTFGLLINLGVAMVLFMFAPGSFLVNTAITGGVIAGLHMLNSYLIEPRVLGHRVGVHPVMVVGSLFVFSHFLGFIGLLIAVPVTAVAQMFLHEWYKRWSSLNKPVYTS